MLSGGLACSRILPLGDDEPWRGREQPGSRPLPCSPCRASPVRRSNHGAATENPDALQGPTAARLDPYAAVIPRVRPVRRRSPGSVRRRHPARPARQPPLA